MNKTRRRTFLAGAIAMLTAPFVALWGKVARGASVASPPSGSPIPSTVSNLTGNFYDNREYTFDNDANGMLFWPRAMEVQAEQRSYVQRGVRCWASSGRVKFPPNVQADKERNRMLPFPPPGFAVEVLQWHVSLDGRELTWVAVFRERERPPLA